VAPGARRYIATDATPEMLDLLTHRVAEVPGVEVRRADALSLDFDAASFDVVLIANLVHLLDDPGSAIREAGRVLRPGGKLVIPTFAHGQGLLARFLSRLLGLSGFPVVTRFRDEQLDALVANNGFEILSARWFRGFLPIRFVVGRVLPQQLVDR
jgi:phosphatidylethanolamine/phosphatidyl-N-methylethanolamine N-methyltransferase